MAKNKKHLKFYLSCMIDECIPQMGLCSCYQESLIGEELELFRPTFEERESYGITSSFWASGYDSGQLWRFTPLRQTIVLFMAAMNNEL